MDSGLFFSLWLFQDSAECVDFLLSSWVTQSLPIVSLRDRSRVFIRRVFAWIFSGSLKKKKDLSAYLCICPVHFLSYCFE